MSNQKVYFLKILFLALLLVASAFSVSAQEGEAVLSKTVNPLIDEFSDLNSESLMARLDYLANIIQSEPDKGINIVIYRDNKSSLGLPYRYGARIKTYLTRNKAIKPEKITVISGNLVDKLKVSIYLMSKGLLNPISKNDDFLQNQTLLFDEYKYIDYDTLNRLQIDDCCSVNQFDNQEAKASKEAFAGILKKSLSAKGYIVGYAQYCVGCIIYGYTKTGGHEQIEYVVQYDKPQIAANILRKEKKYLADKHGINPERVITVNGGYKKSRTVELYFVPEDGEIPKAKPEAFPPEHLKQVKKKARGK